MDYLTTGKLGAEAMTLVIWNTGQLSSWICAYETSTRYIKYSTPSKHQTLTIFLAQL